MLALVWHGDLRLHCDKCIKMFPEWIPNVNRLTADRKMMILSNLTWYMKKINDNAY